MFAVKHWRTQSANERRRQPLRSDRQHRQYPRQYPQLNHCPVLEELQVWRRPNRGRLAMEFLPLSPPRPLPVSLPGRPLTSQHLARVFRERNTREEERRKERWRRWRQRRRERWARQDERDQRQRDFANELQNFVVLIFFVALLYLIFVVMFVIAPPRKVGQERE